MHARLPWGEQVEEGCLVVALVRHGRTAWNAERRFLGQSDVPLDAHGQAQAAELGDALGGRFDAVYTSPLSRAWQTAIRLASEPVARQGLEELDQGDLEGLLVVEGFAQYPEFFEDWRGDPARTVVPGGESLAGCQARAGRALEEIVELHPRGGSIAVVSHQMVIASLVCEVLGEPLHQWRAHGVRNAALTALVWRGGAGRLLFEDWRPSDRGTGPDSRDM